METFAEFDQTAADMEKAPHPHSNAAIAARLVAIREAMGLTQGAFADKYRIPRTSLNMYEAGKRRPSLNDLIKLQLQAGISLEWMLFGNELAMPDRWLTLLRQARQAS